MLIMKIPTDAIKIPIKDLDSVEIGILLRCFLGMQQQGEVCVTVSGMDAEITPGGIFKQGLSLSKAMEWLRAVDGILNSFVTIAPEVETLIEDRLKE